MLSTNPIAIATRPQGVNIISKVVNPPNGCYAQYIRGSILSLPLYILLVHLTADFRSDLAWWCCFIKPWNGRAMMQVLANAQPPYWRSSPIKVLCDNMAVVNIITSNTSRDKLVMHLLRGLHFVSAFYSIQVKIQHIAGSDNTIADAISRDHLQVFFNHAPAASPEPTPIPDPLWSILVSQQPDWLSATWQASLTSSLAIALQRAQERPIPLLKLST